MVKLPRLLFVLKHREGYWGEYSLSSGLFNSVTFLVQMLNDLGIATKMVQVPDNNYIYKEINAFKPTHTIIEAFWVVPEKFDQLSRMYPRMNWSVRNHSELPFLQQEGIALQFCYGYLSRGIEIMNNSTRAVTDMEAIAEAWGFHRLISYAPNYYPIVPYRMGAVLPRHVLSPHKFNPRPRPADDTIRVGCFGAVRPLKNTLEQSVAAIRFAAAIGRKLEFHINSTRIEPPGGDTIIKNLINLFDHTPRAKLIQHPWMNHEEFLDVLAQMDVSMQCSFSETFNIVSADSVSMMVPVVASEEVAWLGAYAWADPNDSTSILNNMLTIDRQIKHQPTSNRLIWQWRDLSNYAAKTRQIWWDRFGA